MIRLSILLYLLAASAAFALGQAQKPSPEFTLAIQAEQSSVKAGQLVVVIVSHMNITGHVINDGRTSNPMEYLTFRISRDGIPVDETAVLKQMHGIGLGPGEVYLTGMTSPSAARLKPGKSSQDTVEVSSYYDMSKPGTYSITVSQETRLGTPEESTTVTSNTITITVLPTEAQ
jgi:hypothetical protein